MSLGKLVRYDLMPTWNPVRLLSFTVRWPFYISFRWYEVVLEPDKEPSRWEMNFTRKLVIDISVLGHNWTINRDIT